MALTIGSMVWGVRDLPRSIGFWTAALHYTRRDPEDGDHVVLVPESGPGPQLALRRVSAPAPRKHHLDLYADDIETEADRLVALGAVRDPDWRYADDDDYIVLIDPDGNPFCVARRPPNAR